MKKIIVFSLICLPFISFAQSKEQLAEMLVEILSLDEWQDQFEQQVEEFGEVIIERQLQAGVPDFAGQQAFQELIDEDLQGSPFQVTILDKTEIRNRGVNQRRLMTWWFKFSDDEIIIMTSAFQEDNRRMVRGQFVFQQDGDEWELVNQNRQEGR